jgi:hypothetical protein
MPFGRSGIRYLAALSLAALPIVACDEAASGPSGGEPAGFSAAYDKWNPGPNDTCTPEIHNQYSVVGPDGLLYPTWHPPVDPETGCTFGHEHGRDPRGSNLYSLVGDLPFGLALAADHVGYKIEWENDVPFRFTGDAASSLLEVRCDVMMELHQGSHGAGAFRINTHEIAIHASCTDQTRVHLTMIATIGHPGEFISSCDRDRTIVAGPPPPDAPDGGGRRLIPDRACIEEFILVPEGERSNFGAGVRESWEVSDRIRTKDGKTLVSFNPYFQVLFPARYYDPALEGGLARTVDTCFEVAANGERAEGGACEETIAAGATVGVPFDDVRSGFRGARRFVDVNSIRISNADGPEVWYTDKYGENAQTEPFPGAIRQFIAKVDNERAVQPSGPAIGRDRDYGSGQSVHAPN